MWALAVTPVPLHRAALNNRLSTGCGTDDDCPVRHGEQGREAEGKGCGNTVDDLLVCQEEETRGPEAEGRSVQVHSSCTADTVGEESIASKSHPQQAADAITQVAAPSEQHPESPTKSTSAEAAEVVIISCKKVKGMDTNISTTASASSVAAKSVATRAPPRSLDSSSSHVLSPQHPSSPSPHTKTRLLWPLPTMVDPLGTATPWSALAGLSMALSDFDSAAYPSDEEGEFAEETEPPDTLPDVRNELSNSRQQRIAGAVA